MAKEESLKGGLSHKPEGMHTWMHVLWWLVVMDEAHFLYNKKNVIADEEGITWTVVCRAEL